MGRELVDDDNFQTDAHARLSVMEQQVQVHATGCVCGWCDSVVRLCVHVYVYVCMCVCVCAFVSVWLCLSCAVCCTMMCLWHGCGGSL